MLPGLMDFEFVTSNFCRGCALSLLDAFMLVQYYKTVLMQHSQCSMTWSVFTVVKESNGLPYRQDFLISLLLLASTCFNYSLGAADIDLDVIWSTVLLF